jgi:hypothetical protein
MKSMVIVLIVRFSVRRRKRDGDKLFRTSIAYSRSRVLSL